MQMLPHISAATAREQKVAFDLKKLAEYDPQGTREFMESHGIQIADAPKQKPKNKSQRER